MVVNGIEIDVGQVWRTRGGAHVTVHSLDDDPTYPVNVLETGAAATMSVTSGGRVLATGRHDDGDLVALVLPAPAKTAACARREANERLSDNPRCVSLINPVLGRLAALKAFEEAGAVAAGRVAVSALLPSGGGKLERKANYYQVDIPRPVDPDSTPYLAECADIIEALNMTFNEGEAFKALWRLAAARQGRVKAGGNPVYDADKVAHYGARTAAQTRAQNGGAA